MKTKKITNQIQKLGNTICIQNQEQKKIWSDIQHYINQNPRKINYFAKFKDSIFKLLKNPKTIVMGIGLGLGILFIALILSNQFSNNEPTIYIPPNDNSSIMQADAMSENNDNIDTDTNTQIPNDSENPEQPNDESATNSATPINQNWTLLNFCIEPKESSIIVKYYYNWSGDQEINLGQSVLSPNITGQQALLKFQPGCNIFELEIDNQNQETLTWTVNLNGQEESIQAIISPEMAGYKECNNTDYCQL